MSKSHSGSRGFGKPKPISKPSDKDRILMYISYMRATLVQAGCPKQAVQSYLGITRRRLINEGSGFLTKARSLFIQGVKILGGDQAVFTHFKMRGKYPRYLLWVFRELEREHEKGVNFDRLHVQRLLSVLYMPKSIKLYSLVAAKREMDAFYRRVTTLGSAGSQFDLRGFQLYDRQGEPCELPKTSFKFVPGERSLKWSKEFREDWKIPRQLYLLSDAYRLKRDGTRGEIPWFVQNTPTVGTVKLLTECGGKYRVICSYNHHMHSNNMRTHLRGILDNLVQDVSKDQSLSEAYLSHITTAYKDTTIHSARIVKYQERKVRKERVKSEDNTVKRFLGMPIPRLSRPQSLEVYEEVERFRTYTTELHPIVSADLSAFTDSLDSRAYNLILSQLGLDPVRVLIASQVKMGDLTFAPKVPLMGLKGCFDLASLIHHCLVQTFVTLSYRMCGDDLVGRFPLESYVECLNKVGLTLNRTKTMVSNTTALFCGRCYHYGLDISPTKPPLEALLTPNLQEVKDASNSFLTKVSGLAKAVFRGFILRSIGRFKVFVSTCLPPLLGGIPLKKGTRSLIDSMSRRDLIIASTVVRSWDLPVEGRWPVNTGFPSNYESAFLAERYGRSDSIRAKRPRRAKSVEYSTGKILLQKKNVVFRYLERQHCA